MDRDSPGLKAVPQEQLHLGRASHSLSATGGDMMSPVIRPVVLNEPSQDSGFFGGGAEVAVFLVADEVRRELRRGQLCSDPFEGGFAFFLERVVDHQLHRVFAVHAIDVDGLVKDRVGDASQVPLERAQPHQRN